MTRPTSATRFRPWTDGSPVDRVMAGHGRFGTAGRSVLGALALRVEREDDALQPAMDGLRSDDGAA